MPFCFDKVINKNIFVHFTFEDVIILMFLHGEYLDLHSSAMNFELF